MTTTPSFDLGEMAILVAEAKAQAEAKARIETALKKERRRTDKLRREVKSLSKECARLLDRMISAQSENARLHCLLAEAAASEIKTKRLLQEQQDESFRLMAHLYAMGGMRFQQPGQP